MNPPKIAYIIGALALVWFIVRLYTNRLAERRQAERDERLAKLYEEREEMMRKRSDDGPHSLGAVVSDSDPPRKSTVSEVPEKVKVRCKACRALNDESATDCSSCGEKL